MHHKLNEHLHQTGRTTRQLAQALALSKLGYRVTYVVVDQNTVRYTRDRLNRLTKGERHEVEVESVRKNNDFDFTTMRPYQAPIDNRIWIVDHDVIEIEIARLAQRVVMSQLLIQQLYPLSRGEPVATLYGMVPDGDGGLRPNYKMPGHFYPQEHVSENKIDQGIVQRLDDGLPTPGASDD